MKRSGSGELRGPSSGALTHESIQRQLLREFSGTGSLLSPEDTPTQLLPVVRKPPNPRPLLDWENVDESLLGVTDPRMYNDFSLQFQGSGNGTYYINTNLAVTGIHVVIAAIGKHWRERNCYPACAYISPFLAPALVKDAELLYQRLYEHRVYCATGGSHVQAVPVFLTTVLAENVVYCKD